MFILFLLVFIVLPKVIDNFLSDEDFCALSSVILSDHFYWFRNPIITKGAHSNFGQMYHQFYACNNDKQSDFFSVVQPLLCKLGQLVLFRVKANLNPCDSVNTMLGDFHTDFPGFQSTTAIFYLNTNNGWTEFEDSQKIFSKSNRLVVFPQEIRHVGFSCTDQPFRCLININFLARS